MRQFTKCFLGLIGSTVVAYPYSTLADSIISAPISSNNDTFLGKLGNGRAARDGLIYSDSYIRLPTSTVQVNEGDGSVKIMVERTCSDKSLPAAVASYQIVSEVGTATAGVDYGAAYGTLKWGENECGMKEFYVPLVDDLEPEFDEDFQVLLSDVHGAMLPTVETSAGNTYFQEFDAYVKIVDNDADRALKNNRLSFSEPSYQLTEAGGTLIEVKREQCEPHSPEVSVDVVVTPENQEDYNVELWYSSGGVLNDNVVTLHWDKAHVQNDCGSKYLYIQGKQDTIREPSETLELVLTHPSDGATLEQTPIRTVEIMDDDSSTIGFTQDSYAFGKDSKTAVIVERKNCVGDVPAATVEVIKGWYQESYTLTWQENECGSKNLELPISNYRLNVISGATLAQETSNGYFLDSRMTLIGFTQKNYNVLESNSLATIGIERLECDQNGYEATMRYATYSGSACPNSFICSDQDYSDQYNELSWEEGECSPKKFSVPLISDSKLEENETIFTSLYSLTEGIVTNSYRSQAKLTIIDDDPEATITPTDDLGAEPITLVLAAGTADALNISNAKAPLNWNISDKNLITVDAAGNLTALAPGRATVTMTDAYKRTFSWQVTVVAKDLTILSFQTNSNYKVGEYLDVKINARPAIPDHNQQVDLWVGVRTADMPEDQLLYVTDSSYLSGLFSAIPQPFKRGLQQIDNVYPLLHFVTTPEMIGEYTLYAIFTESGKTPFEENTAQRSVVATQMIQLNGN